MHCEGNNIKIKSHNTSYCLIKVVIKLGLALLHAQNKTIYRQLSWIFIRLLNVSRTIVSISTCLLWLNQSINLLSSYISGNNLIAFKMAWIPINQTFGIGNISLVSINVCIMCISKKGYGCKWTWETIQIDS